MKKLTLITLTLLLTTALLLPPATAEEDVTRWELPEGATLRLGKGGMLELAYSPDGALLAVASGGIGVWLYDAQTYQERALLTGFVTRVAFSPDGATLASASSKEIRLWDVATGTLQHTLTGHTDEVFSVAFSPDGRTLASGSWDGPIRLWDVATGTVRQTLTEHTGRVSSVAFSPDGRTLASGSEDATVRLWDVATGTVRQTLTEHTSSVLSVVFSPDGRTLASGGGWNNPVRLWDVATGTVRQTLTEHTGWSGSVVFSPDGRTLASGGHLYNPVRLWDVATGETRHTLTSNGSLVAFSPDGRTLANADSKTIRLWDVATGETRHTLTWHTGSVFSVAFSPDGATLASGGWDDIVLWDVATGTVQHTLTEHTGGILSVVFSPDGRTLASGGWDDIVLWDVATGTVQHTLTEHTGGILSVVFSPDGRTLASGGRDDTIRLWDVQTGHLRAILTGHTDDVFSVAFSPDGATLASGGGPGDKTIRLWDVHTGSLRATLTEHTARPLGIVFSPDGTTLISTGDSTIRVWDVRNGKLVKVLGVPCTATSGPAISPDGRFIAVGDAFLRILLIDPTADKIIGSFPGHATFTLTVAINPDGTILASAGANNGAIILWDLTPFTSQEQPPQEHADSVRVVYFQPSDRAAQPGIDAQLRTLVTDVQQFYARQMEAHGHGEKTITFATDTNGNVIVRHFTGEFTDAYYQTQTYDKVHKELSDYFHQSKHVYLVAIDISSEVINDDGTCGVGGGRWWNRFEGEAWHRDLGGLAVIPASGACFNVGVTAHELGHAMGLDHDFRDDTYLMAYGSQQRLSREAAAWLDASRLFNPSQPDLGQPAAIEVLSNRAAQLRFQLTDGDGLHQAQLLIPTTPEDPAQGTKLHRSQALNGKQSLTIAFSAVPVVSGQEVTLQVIDVHGNIAKQTFSIEGGRVTPESIAEDVNEDGVVNFADLSLAALRLGEAGQNRADVNGDGVVDAADLLLIAAAIQDAAGAPARHPHVLEIFTAAEVQHWLKFARQLALTEPAYQRGIAVLEQLLAILTPKETVLLANYPNPFNPETWLPYRLAEPAEVTVRIYAANGSLIRMLALGHLPAGIYEDRSRAAYWDGRNAQGEPVASGVYFYTLSAGDFTATRKMVIRK